MTVDWQAVADRLDRESSDPSWCYGQGRSLRAAADRLRSQGGVLIADEVGLGKTRIVLAVVRAVTDLGGTAAVLVPPGLIFQWEQEWREYTETGVAPVSIRSFDHLLRAGGRRWPLLSPVVQSGGGRPWGIFSHRFGVPHLAINSVPKRFGLPALALALRRSEGSARGFRNSSLWRFAKGITKRCFASPCGSPDCPQCDLQAAARYLAGHPNTSPLDQLDGDRCIESTAAALYLTREWRTSFLALIRQLIGTVDLVVIDEAHRSRDQGVGDTILGELARFIVPTRGRRIALTATPVELDVSQWEEVLQRAGVTSPPMQAIGTFSDALSLAQRHPDRADALRNLLEASTAFRTALQPYVIRRRRIAQDEMRTLVGNTAGAHPHRTQQIARIPYAAVVPSWRPVVLALDGLGKAAKGSGCSGALRTADIRYASGHVNTEVMTEETDSTKVLSSEGTSDLTGKLRRIAYWRRIAQQGISQDATGLASHPRIAAIAGRLDGLLHADGDEKILVFGVFTRPLRALVESLNRRALLRLLDRGLPFPTSEDDGATSLIWADYQSSLNQVETALPEARPYHNRLALRLPDIRSLERLLLDADRSYQRLRSAMQRHLDADFLRSLPGDAAISRLASEDRKHLLELLRTRIIGEDMIGETTLRQQAPDRDWVQQRGRDLWIADFLHPCRDQEEEATGLSDGEGTPWTGDTALADLDRLGDAIDSNRLHHLIAGEVDAGLGRFGHFARLLIGDTRMETRRTLQAQFNRAGSYPRVLVAQSRVGREGLNLHRSCRRVVIFHPEWNPAVLEQQIGRVDRIESRWERLAKDWRREGSLGEMPKIVVEHVVFEGTYDEYQWSVVEGRRRNLRAQLQGELLDPDAMARVPEDLKAAVAAGAPDFEP